MGYEEMILSRQESEADECKDCEFASPGKCKNQCMKLQKTFNLSLKLEV